MLIFATPALCQSRVCGPVVDIAEQVKADYDGDAEFIHMEIYNDNELDKGFREQVLAWKLPTEPWAFTIDSAGQGRRAARGRVQRARAARTRSPRRSSRPVQALALPARGPVAQLVRAADS